MTDDEFAEAIRQAAAERERCAKIAEAVAEKIETLDLHNELTAADWAAGAALRCAKRIREGGE